MHLPTKASNWPLARRTLFTTFMLSSLACAQDRGIAYAVDSDGNDDLYAINLDDGSSALIGATGFPSIEGLAFHPDGRLFAVDDNTDELVRLDLNDGVGRSVGSLDLRPDARQHRKYGGRHQDATL